ncbi:MAG TPA: FtsX-like permease family protein [Acetobacteraceae bacterium]|nr:FtsX-like permease family protein [Acetobacteraceae bacterium]
MLLLGGFGVLALLLASVGTYGVISFAVIQRTPEIGIRIALGAGRRQILAMILSQGSRLVCVGIAVGLIGAFTATRLMTSFLYGIQPTDPVTFAAASLLLISVALAACYVRRGERRWWIHSLLCATSNLHKIRIDSTPRTGIWIR